MDDLDANIRRILGTVHRPAPAELPPVPVVGELPPVPVAAELPAPAPAEPTTAERLARIVWAARELMLSWDRARVLGIATANGASVPELLAAVDHLRAALAGNVP